MAIKTIILSMLFVLQVYSATYYVDFSAGDDTANGTTELTPWKHCPGDGLAESVPAGTMLSAGDTVLLKGGVEYYSKISLTNSGTVGNNITIGSYSTGRAILNGQNSPEDSRRFGITATNQSNIIFNNIEFCYFGGHTNVYWTTPLPSAVYGYGIYLSQCTNIVVTNSFFHHIGDWTNAPYMSETIMVGNAINIDRAASNITVSGCEFTKIARAGIAVVASYNSSVQDVLISSNNIHDYVVWGIELAANSASTTLNGITITNNIIHDLWGYAADTLWQGLEGYHPHVDGIICFIGGNPQYTNVTLGTSSKPLLIIANRFYSDTTNKANCGTAIIFLSGYGGRVVVANNLFMNVLTPYGGIYVQDETPNNGTTLADYWFVNNSFYDVTKGISLRSLTSGYELTNGTINIHNNIFYKNNTDSAMMISAGYTNSSPSVLNYNMYYTKRGDSLVALLYESALSYKTFSQLQSAGHESGGISADPQWSNITYGLDTNTSLNNLALSGTSTAIGAGTNLSSIFTTDILGTPRGSSWDIGAYEYSPEYPPQRIGRWRTQ